MHLYVVTRGIKHCVDRFISDLQAQYFPFEFTDPETKKKSNIIQLGVRPIQLWEIVFPKESLNEVLATVIKSPPEFNSTQQKALSVLRKLLKCKPIPEIPPNSRRRIVFDQHIECSPIGIKDDIMHPTQGHEML